MIKFLYGYKLSSSDGNILSCFQAFIRIIPASSSVFLKEKIIVIIILLNVSVAPTKYLFLWVPQVLCGPTELNYLIIGQPKGPWAGLDAWAHYETSSINSNPTILSFSKKKKKKKNYSRFLTNMYALLLVHYSRSDKTWVRRKKKRINQFPFI